MSLCAYVAYGVEAQSNAYEKIVGVKRIADNSFARRV